MTTSGRIPRVTRRQFLRAAPVSAVALTAPGAPGAAQTTAADTSPETLRCAETIAGLDFTDADRDLARGAVDRDRERYEQLRTLDIADGMEPPVVFRPYAAGQRPSGGATPGARLPRVAPANLPRVASSLEDLALLPVTTLATLLERRLVSSIDLTRMYLSRLERYGDQLECVVTLTHELALVQAVEADREIKAGRYRGPLHGVPWGAKDLFATRGARTTWGARPFEQQILDYDATIVERLREAGAVLVAKLSMGALARGGVWFGGSTRNPWDVSRSSSGSSAGPAAATAAGLVGFGVGTETLGSIVSPSAACGVTGLRPTYGRVSRYGAMALSWTMDKIGPLCRSVEDCALVFNAIYGPDGRDEAVVDAPFVWEGGTSLAGLRIGYVRAEFENPPPGTDDAQLEVWKQQSAAQAAALDVLRALGARLEPIDLPDFPADALRLILNVESAAAFDDLTRTRGVDQLTGQGPDDWPNSFRASRFVPAVEYLRAQQGRGLLMNEMARLMASYEAFVSPTRSASLTMTNFTGHPALVVKAGFVNGLPVSLMITGRLYDEATILRIGLAYEQRTEWHTRHPALR